MTDQPITLEDLAALGYVVDEWRRWQQGECWVYAAALVEWSGGRLRFGSLYEHEEENGEILEGAEHHFAHDDTHAYDSAGRRPLADVEILWPRDRVGLDEQPEWHRAEPLTAEELHAVLAHVRRNGIELRPPCTCDDPLRPGESPQRLNP